MPGFNLVDYLENENKNYHTENAVKLTKKYGTKKEIKQVLGIQKRHRSRGYLAREDSTLRYDISEKYYSKLLKDSKKKDKEIGW